MYLYFLGSFRGRRLGSAWRCGIGPGCSTPSPPFEAPCLILEVNYPYSTNTYHRPHVHTPRRDLDISAHCGTYPPLANIFDPFLSFYPFTPYPLFNPRRCSGVEA